VSAVAFLRTHVARTISTDQAGVLAIRMETWWIDHYVHVPWGKKKLTLRLGTRE
jgi:hypothetical protein